MGVTNVTKLRIEIPMDDETLGKYEKIARYNGIQLEDVIADHLKLTADFTDDEPVYFNNEQAAEIRSLLGARINTAPKIIDMIRRIVGLKVSGLKVRLSPNQLEQIKWYAKSAGKPVEEVAQMIVERAIVRELKTR
jgi:hypothetical protein